MTFLPIVERELRVAARQPATYWTRFFFVLAVLLLWLLILMNSRHVSPHELSQMMFVAVGILCLGFTMLAGVIYTADCLSAEKRDGTLGLLFLTDLKGFDVVIGKLAGTSTHGISGLLTVFPLMAMPLLMGGISGAEFARQLAVLAATLFLSLSLGLLVSALVREATTAIVVTLVVMVLLAGALPAISGLLAELNWILYQDNPLNWLSPCWAYALAFDSNSMWAGRGFGYAASLMTLLAAGVVCMALACCWLPRKWQEQEVGKAALRRKRKGWRRWFGTSKSRHVETMIAARAEVDSRTIRSSSFSDFRSYLGGRSYSRHTTISTWDPFLWIASRDSRARKVVRWGFVALVLLWLGIVVACFLNKARDFGFGVGVFGAYVLHVVFKCLVAVEATRQFSDDRASGAMELLLVTPLSERSILKSQWTALRHRFFWLRLLVFLVNALLVWLMFNTTVVGRGTERTIFLMLFLSGMFLLFLDFHALCWVGMEAGLKCPRHHRAVLATLARVMAPGLGVLFLFALMMFGGAFRSQESVFALLFMWVFVNSLIDLGLSVAARDRLQDHFRWLASGEPPPLRIAP